MEPQNPLFWHQGLFLQPQHFQLMDLAWDSKLTPFREWMTPHFWGVQDLELKQAALGIRSFGLVKGRFFFPDGTHIEFPGNAVIEDRSFEEAWVEGGKPFPVYLGLRKWDAEGENVTVVKKGDSLSGVTTRFIAPADPVETQDLHAGGPTGHVKKLTYLIKVFWGSEKDHLGDYVLIPVAEIERQGTAMGLSNRFIPPCLTVSASDTLVHLIQETEDLIASRCRQLEEHKIQRGIHSAEFGSKDMVYLLALRTLNRSLPCLRHYAQTPQIHPWPLYGALRQVIGDLSCFSEHINVLGEDRDDAAAALPAYNPLTLWECFSTARNLIVRLLDEITAGPDHIVTLQPADGIYTAEVKPTVLDDKNRFYLALTTEDDPKKALRTMDTLAKLSSRNHLGVLLSHALPGVPLNYLSVPPQELPRRSNVLYFAIDAHNDQWASVKKEHSVAFSWDGAPESLKVELMAVGR